MKEIRLKAYAKINIGLDVIGRNPNGYHNVKMIMQGVNLHDDVIISLADDGSTTMSVCTDRDDMDISGIPTDERNLCIKAANRFFDEVGVSQGVHIRLIKRIPSEAGMAGGSTDGAAVFVGLNDLLGKGFTKDKLAEMALPLGADIPYCIYGGTKLTEGIGERFTDISPPLKDTSVVLIKPDFGVSTARIYNMIDSLSNPVHPDIDAVVSAIENNDIAGLGAKVGNIMEDVVAKFHPEIERLKEDLRQQGAYVSSMSGSGTCVYGLFSDDTRAEKAKEALKAKYPEYFCEQTFTINKGVSYD